MKKLIVLGVVLLMFAAAPALADDLNIPWYRGEPLSYHAEWDVFAHSANPAGFLADSESSVGGPGTAELYAQWNTHLDFTPSIPVNPTGWTVVPSGGDWGLTDLSTPVGNSFVANVVNWVDYLPTKLLRVQVAYTDPGGGPPMITGVVGHGVDSPPAPQGSGDTLHESELVFGDYSTPGYFYEDWVIHPNPDWEQVQFFLPFGTIVDQIVIDTISLPEPAGLGLVGLALLAVRKRRR